jgi:hypothetical protein
MPADVRVGAQRRYTRKRRSDAKTDPRLSIAGAMVASIAPQWIFSVGEVEIYRKPPVAAAAQCIFNINWRSRAPGGRVISEFRHHFRRRAGDMVILTSPPPPAGDTGIPASLRDPRARSRRSAPSVHRPGAEDARHRPPAGTAAQYNLEPCAMPPRIPCARQPVPGRRAACFCYLVAVAGFS